VLLFPSVREGFGMAVVDSLYVGLPVIAWRIPVFEELYTNTARNSNNDNCHFKGIILIEPNNHELFADEAIMTLNSIYNGTLTMHGRKISTKISRIWNEIGDNVLTVLQDMNNHQCINKTY